MWAPVCKLCQRRTIELIGGCTHSDVTLFSLLSLCLVLLLSCNVVGVAPRAVIRVAAGYSCAAAINNIGGGDFSEKLCHDPIDVVYTWVNGSDTKWLSEMLAYRARWNAEAGRMMTDEEEDLAAIAAAALAAASANASNVTNATQDDSASSMSRYRDNNELRYSIRSLYKYAPWIRRIYIVTNGQVPSWLNVEHARVRIVTHAEIFPSADDLPTFSSPAIETHLHRIPGVSRRFIYFNDDVMLGAPVWPDAFFTDFAGQKFYPAWDVPKCAPGCVDNWISDGYCDSSCNNTQCLWDGGDCINNTKSRGGATVSSDKYKSSRYDPSQYDRVSTYSTDTATSSESESPVLPTFSEYCAPGCPDEWLGDLVCDFRCRTAACGWDAGDCASNEIPPLYSGSLNFSSAGAQHALSTGSLWRQVTNDVLLELDSLNLTLRAGAAALCSSVSPNTTEFESAFNGTANSSRCVAELEASRPGSNTSIFDAVNAAIDATVFSRGYYSSERVILATPTGDDCVCSDNVTDCTDAVPHGARIDISNALADAGLRIKLSFELRARLHDCTVNASIDDAVSAFDCARDQLARTLDDELVRKMIESTDPVSVIQADHKYEPALRLALLAPSQKVLLLLLRAEALSLAVADARAINYSSFNQTSRFPCIFSQDSNGVTQSSYNLGELTLWLNVTWNTRSGNFSAVDDESTIGPIMPMRLVLPLGAHVRSLENACTKVRQPAASFTPNASITVNASEANAEATGPSGSPTSPTLAPSPTAASQDNALSEDTAKDVSSSTTVHLRRSSVSKSSSKFGSKRGRALLEEDSNKWKDLYAVPLRWAAAAHADAAADLMSSDARSLISLAWAQLVALSAEASALAPTPARGRILADFYAESLVATNRLITAAFGKRARKVPSHMPHMIDVRAMEKLQSKWPSAFSSTSSRRFRTGVDVQYAYAYFHFLLEGGARDGIDVETFFSSELDSDGDGILNANELSTLAAIVYRRTPTGNELATLRECLVGPAAPSNVTVSRVRDGPGIERVEEVRVAHVRLPTWDSLVGCQTVIDALAKNGRFGPMAQDMGTAANDEVSFEMVGDDVNKTHSILDGVRAKRPRFICINDDMNSPGDAVKQALKDFYDSFAGRPSPLELPEGVYNEVLYIDPLRKLLRERRIQHAAYFAAAVVGAVVACMTLLSLYLARCSSRSSPDDTWSARGFRALEALTSPVPSTPMRPKSAARSRGHRGD
jgi:hypothetical protein